ncbi:AraC family transcriptional regulator [Bacteroides acidifaciens]|uniref:AraC family transcriptional regulator n=1 Tax=Bacteroides acidifaciens TaxID=85831 RepID=UPI0025975C56|nr:AraC family transcriptional regulator [Bacteroides acidifaciens]
MQRPRHIAFSDIMLNCHYEEDSQCALMVRDHILFYVYSGEVEVHENGHIIRLHKGKCAFIRKDNCVSLVKRPLDGQPYHATVLRLTRHFLHGFYRKLSMATLPDKSERSKKSLLVLPSDRPDIVSLFESIKPYYYSDSHPSEEWLNLKMIEGVYVLLNTNKSLYASLFDFVEPWKIDILEFLNHNYMYDLSLEDMASFTGRSLATFKRDFAKISDCTPMKWIIKKRLETAHYEITEKGRKVSEVCVDVGFKSLSHFSRLYKQAYGAAPTK